VSIALIWLSLALMRINCGNAAIDMLRAFGTRRVLADTTASMAIWSREKRDASD